MDEMIISREIEVKPEDMIVSSTDKKGNIIYANDIFCNVVGYSREDLIGKPHNIVRHADMPKVVFKILWDTVLKGKPVDAFVKNKKSDGDYYWVKATVIPTIKNGEITQITSYRKPLNNFAKSYVIELYAKLVEYEKTHSVEQSYAFVGEFLKERGLTYQQFIDRLSLQKGVDIVNIVDQVKFRNLHITFKAHIIDAIKNKDNNIEVVGHEMCEFGHMLKKLSNEPFTKTKEWQNIVEYHESVHKTLHKYVDRAKSGADESELKTILTKADEETNEIFKSLTQLVDGYKG